MRTVKLTRRVTFSSGHRYWRNGLSREENHALFGRWASPYNHGHNYVLDVTTEGPIDPVNGMVVNIKTIDDLIRAQVVSQFDQRSINDEIPYFANQPSTLENILLYIRDEICNLPAGVSLTDLRLEELPTLWAEWHQEKENEVIITRTYEFAASHRLHVPAISDRENIELFGKCNNPSGHGHNYLLEVSVAGKPDPKTGMAVDIDQLDSVVHKVVVDRYDHKNLSSDIPEFDGLNATTEVVVAEIFNRLKSAVPGTLARVRLHETARNIFEVSAE